MPIRSKTCQAVVVCLSALLPGGVCAEGIDTEHLFGFMIGTDVGNVGERELQSQTNGRFCQEWRNVPGGRPGVRTGIRARQEFSGGDGNHLCIPLHPRRSGFEDRRQSSWEGVSIDLRYRFLERDEAPFGFTFAVENHASRVDETTAAAVRSYGTEFTAAFDRELIPNVVVAALNLTYQPEWTRIIGTGAAEQESTIGAALGLMVQWRPGFFLGGEARYLRRYEGIGLEELAGQAVVCWPNRLFPIVEAHTADRGLEHAGMGTSGRIERSARPRKLRTPSGAADIRRQFLRRGAAGGYPGTGFSGHL